jgi:cell division protein FtsI (penicillin-binding protein 3)
MAAKSSPNPKTRLYALGGFFLFWLLMISFRLLQLEVVDYGEWMQRAARQQQRSIEVAARRGNIYDRNGHELAMSIDVDSVFAVPSEIPDPETTASLLGRVLNLPAPEIVAKLRGSHSFAWIARKIDADESKRLRAMNLRGIYFEKEPKRFYPKRELAAQTLGYVGVDDEGLGGIEHEYDDQLRGQPGRMQIVMDARRKWFGRVEKYPDAGENVVLTIDEKIQYIAERELEKALADTHAIAGTVVVQNPHTGEILALASRPTFNPNSFRHVPLEALKNRAVSDMYEPGSVFKIVTYSAALQEQLIHPDDMIDTQGGVISIGNLRIHDLHKMGVVPISEALAHSSDVAAVKVGMKLGDDRFYSFIHNYGFGQPTGIELPGETRGVARPPNRWSKVSIGAVSIGQEVGVTPLQLVSMVSTIANDGIYTPPRIVAGVLPPRGTPQTVTFHPAQQRRVVSPLVSAEMRKMLEGVVLFGTAKRAILDGYSSAGKTGTAQKVDPATGTYSKTNYVATFAGFAPVNTPAITILVSLDSPKGLHQGGQVSAPVFARIAQQVLAYLNVPHDVELDPKRLQLRAAARNEDLSDNSPDRIGAEWTADDEVAQSATAPPTAAAAKASTPEKATAAKMQPEAVAAASVPAKAAEGTVVLDVGGGVTVPSFVGKTMRSAVETAQDAGIELEAVGSGVAREQSPAPGSRVAGGARVVVRFAR